MNKGMNNFLPTHLSNYFIINNVLHDHYTRQSDNLHMISHRTQAGANCIRLRGVTIWNAIEITIKSASSFFTFKNRFEYYLVTKTGPWIINFLV